MTVYDEYLKNKDGDGSKEEAPKDDAKEEKA